MKTCQFCDERLSDDVCRCPACDREVREEPRDTDWSEPPTPMHYLEKDDPR